MKKTISLKSNQDFILSYKNGKFFAGRYLVLYALPNKFEIHRLGITVSKKVGKSVKRNNLKRLIRENFRFVECSLKEWHDFVFVVRRNEQLPGFYEIGKEMKYLLRKLRLIDAEI